MLQQQRQRPLSALVVGGFAMIVAAGQLAHAQVNVAADNHKNLQGTWVIESVEHGGKKMDVLVGGKMVFTDREHSIRPRGTLEKSWAKGVQEIDSSKSPKHIDIDPQTGPHIGKTHLGIYEIDGNGCRICFADPPTDKRPTDFKSEDGTGLALFVLKRWVRPSKLHAAENSNIKSISSDFATKMEFLNRSQQTIKVYWLDFEGERQLYSTLKDGDANELATYLTHPWLITDEADNPWYVYFPDGQPRIVEIFAPEK